jgi:hypothetical protein
MHPVDGFAQSSDAFAMHGAIGIFTRYTQGFFGSPLASRTLILCGTTRDLLPFALTTLLRASDRDVECGQHC